MAKVYESDVDPDDFIRSFREEPSGVSSLKKKPADNTEDKNPETATVPESPPAVKPRQRSSASKEDEEMFSQRFVRNMSHMRPQMKYLMVEVSPEFVRKIRRILSYENGPSCSVKAYVNNVLAEHFKEFEDIIKKRL
ncbi:DUF3408 domain-containing protein [uncultured Duncaniella sp.]|uniref:DUF3408 domain-containing protein n=1 Tax=uncultured Duncaniella sp. TaxID=2768039 RepID=UPI0025A9C8AB|nr:DUF3408 domain-containing protein [uncultured Duncaniella sp.]